MIRQFKKKSKYPYILVKIPYVQNLEIFPQSDSALWSKVVSLSIWLFNGSSFWHENPCHSLLVFISFIF